MTKHLTHGSIPSFVERNPARHNQTMPLAETSRLLADPIEFSQNVARVIEHGLLAEVLMEDEPKQIDDLRQEFEFLVETAIRRKDVPAIAETFLEYHQFVTYALAESREYGVALGAVMEQLRVGLGGVVDLRNRGLTTGDIHAFEDLMRLRRKHDLPYSSGWGETDGAKVKEVPVPTDETNEPDDNGDTFGGLSGVHGGAVCQLG